MVGAFPLVLISVSSQAPDFPKFDRSEERGIRVHRSVGLLYVVVMLRSFICVFAVQREFFYPKCNMPRTKVEHFVSLLKCNLNNASDFFKRFTVQMTSTQLDAFLPKLENAVEITDKLLFL